MPAKNSSPFGFEPMYVTTTETSMPVWAVSNVTKLSIAFERNMSAGMSPDCANCERWPILMSLMTQSEAPFDCGALYQGHRRFHHEPLFTEPLSLTKKRSGRNATRCGRAV